jgi:hypothetical protein
MPRRPSRERALTNAERQQRKREAYTRKGLKQLTIVIVTCSPLLDPVSLRA